MTNAFDLGFGIPSLPIDTSALSQSAALHQQIQTQVLNHLNQGMNEQAHLHQSLQDSIQGHLQQQIFKQQDKVDKVNNKIETHLYDQLGNVIVQGMDAGIQPIPPDQLPPVSNGYKMLTTLDSQGNIGAIQRQTYQHANPLYPPTPSGGQVLKTEQQNGCTITYTCPPNAFPRDGQCMMISQGPGQDPVFIPVPPIITNSCDSNLILNQNGNNTNTNQNNNLNTDCIPPPGADYNWVPPPGCTTNNNGTGTGTGGSCAGLVSLWWTPGNEDSPGFWCYTCQGDNQPQITQPKPADPFNDPNLKIGVPWLDGTFADSNSAWQWMKSKVGPFQAPPPQCQYGSNSGGGNTNTTSSTTTSSSQGNCIPICGISNILTPPQCPPCNPQSPPPPPPAQCNYDVYFNCQTGQTLILPSDVDQQLPSAEWKFLTSSNGQTGTDLTNTINNALTPAIQQQGCQFPQDDLPVETLTSLAGDWQSLDVGSPKWCEVLDTISQSFAKMGQELIALLLIYDNLSGGDCQASATDQTDTGTCDLQSSIGDLLGSAVSASIQATGGLAGLNFLNPANWDAISTILGMSNIQPIAKSFTYSALTAIGLDKNTSCEVAKNLDPSFLIKYLRETMCTIFTSLSTGISCNPIIVSGLVFVRGLLGFLKHLRGDFVAGIDFIGKAGIKIAFHLPIEIRPVEQIVDYLLHWACPTKLPSEGDVRELALRQEITPDHYSCFTKLHGLSPYFAGKLLHAKREKIGHHEVIEYYRRHPELTDNTDKLLAKMGWIDDGERNIIKDLYNEIPDVQMHLAWMRRNADSPLFVAEFGLWVGFDSKENVIALYNDMLNDPDVAPERKTEIQQAIPIIQTTTINPVLATRNFWNTFNKDLLVKGWLKKNAFYEYCAHWQPINWEDGLEFFRRLRPNRVDPSLVFTRDNLYRSMLERDLDPRMLERYLAISYRTFNQRYLQMLAKIGLIDEKEVGERLQDIGFSPPDSKTLAHGLELQRRQQVATEFHGWNAANIIQKYKEHLVSKEQATNGLKYLGATPEDISQAFGVADLHKEHATKNEWVSTIKKGFMRGLYDDNTAQQMLVTAGVEQDQANHLLDLWKAEMFVDIHNPTTRELLDAYVNGWMDVNELATRLQRMNYSYDSIGLMIATANMKITQQEDKDKEKQQRLKEAQAKEIAKQIREQQKQIYRQARIKLNLARATERASLIVMRQDTRTSANLAKNILKLSTISGLTNSKDSTSQQLLRIAQDATNQIAKIKDKLAIDKAQTTDKVAKAQMTNDANDQIAKIKQDAQSKAEQVKNQQSQYQASQQAQQGQGDTFSQATADSTLATTEAAVINSDALAQVGVENLNPA